MSQESISRKIIPSSTVFILSGIAGVGAHKVAENYFHLSTEDARRCGATAQAATVLFLNVVMPWTLGQCKPKVLATWFGLGLLNATATEATNYGSDIGLRAAGEKYLSDDTANKSTIIEYGSKIGAAVIGGAVGAIGTRVTQVIADRFDKRTKYQPLHNIAQSPELPTDMGVGGTDNRMTHKQETTTSSCFPCCK